MNSAKCSTSSCGHRPRAADDGVAGAQVLEVLAERVLVGDRARAARHPASGDRREHVRAALHRRALHVVRDAAHPAHLLAAAGAPGPAVHELGHRRAVARRLLRVGAVEHQQAPVPRRDAQDDVAGEIRVGGDDRAGQRALPARGQRDDLGGRRVRQHRRHRAERLDLVHGGGVAGSATSRTGDRNAPRSASAPRTSTCSGSPNTTSAASVSDFSERRTSSRCSSPASAPIVTPSVDGSPTTTAASFSRTASTRRRPARRARTRAGSPCTSARPSPSSR